MKKSFKKLLASLLVAVMVLSVAPIGALTEIDLSSLFAVEASALTSGSYTYTVSGSNATITAYSGTASSLSIPSTLGGYTVTAIGPGAFANNTYLTSVSLPGTLTNLGGSSTTWEDGTFQNCAKLKTVTFAAGTKDAVIGTETFMGCTSLQSVTIPGNYNTIKEYAFNGCTSLQSMTWKKSDYSYANQVIEPEAFSGCTSLASISLPTTLSTIGAASFVGNAATSITIPEGVTAIGHAAFMNCPSLTSVSLPSTLTNLGGSSVTWEEGAFQNCAKLKIVTFAAGNKDAVIGTETFMGCTSLQSVTIPGNYNTIKEYAFNGCTSLQSMTWKKSDYSYANQVIEPEAFSGCTSLASISLPTTLSTIGAASFVGNAATSITIPEGVTAIGHAAFMNCPSLTSVSLPSTLTNLGGSSVTWEEGAFQNCAKLKIVIFAAGNKDAVIGTETFMGCTSLQSVTIPGNYNTIKEYAFNGCTSLQSMTWKKSDYSYANQVIEPEAFSGCTSLASISLPTTLSTIGAASFVGNAATSITIPEGVTAIGHAAFMNCPSLTSVSLPSTLTNLGGSSTTWEEGAFQNCTKLKTVIFAEGSSDLTIGAETFKNCSNLTTVHLPLNLVEIKEQAFDGSKTNLTICSKSNSSYGKTYADNNSIKFKLCNGSHTTTPTTTYTVTYNANGGSISPSSVSVKAGESVSLPIPSAKTYTITYNANGGSGAPSAQSFAVACKGWSTNSTATSASYACGTKYTPTKNVTLYAVWNNATDVTVSTKIPMRAGYSFRGWSTVSNATTPTVGVGSEWSITSNITLYAVWEKISTPTPSYKEENVSMNYKDTMTVNGAVSVETSNSGVASVSGNKITAADTGSADVTVTYEDGSVCVYHIDVSYSWWQWIIVIVLFGWIWY